MKNTNLKSDSYLAIPSHIRPKKRLGQNFLVNKQILNRIVSALNAQKDDIIIEVGAGFGALTRILVEHDYRVLAVELDDDLLPILQKLSRSYSNLTIVHGDILKLKPSELIQIYDDNNDMKLSYKVVGNLPYYITSPLIHHFLTSSRKPSRMVLMVQKEVGETITAKPGKMSYQSVAVQLYSEAVLLDYVKAKEFFPIPKVDSVIMTLDIYESTIVPENDIDDFLAVVRHSFRAPRKQIHNSLAISLQLDTLSIQNKLNSIDIDHKRRPGTLTMREWVKLFSVFRGDNINR